MAVFNRNDVIAVLGEGNEVWLCKSLEKVKSINERSRQFKAVWFEKSNRDEEYVLGSEAHLVPLASVLKRVRLVKVNEAYKLPLRTRLELLKLVSLPNQDYAKPSKQKRKASIKNSNLPRAKKLKVEKAYVDKSNPNWRLEPRPEVKVWTKDPLFESKEEEVIFVSPSAHSHLITRAVLMNDMASLKKYIKDKKNVSSISQRRSIKTALSPMHYAIKMNNLKAIQLLKKEMKAKQKRVDPARCHLQVVNTGIYNYRSLGVRHIRQLQMSRGGREGNNAFTKAQWMIVLPHSCS